MLAGTNEYESFRLARPSLPVEMVAFAKSSIPVLSDAVRKRGSALVGERGEEVWLAKRVRTERASRLNLRLVRRLHREDGDHPLEIVGENLIVPWPRGGCAF